MMVKFRHSFQGISLLLLLVTNAANCEDFDWKLLNGVWAESTDGKYGCRPENLHHTFVLAPDKKSMTFALDRKWKVATGQELDRYSAQIISQATNSLVIRYGTELPGMTEEMQQWELRFIGPGTYRWRSSSWPEGQFNTVIGVKCGG